MAEETDFMSSNIDWEELGIDPNEEVGTADSEYVPTSQFPIPPPIGNYEFQGTDGGYAWGRGNDGSLYLKNCKFSVVGGEFDGKKLDGFISNRATPFRKNGTDLEDFIRAAGAVPKNGSRFTNAEMVKAVEETFNAIRKGYVTWEGYCSDCGKTVARGKNGATKENKDGFRVVGFLKGETLSPVVQCPLCGKMITARAKVQKFYVG